MERIPEDVEALVRRAAQASPGYSGDLAEIPRIARRQRNRQVAAAFAGVAAAFAGVAAAFAGVAAVLALVGVGVTVNRDPHRPPVNPPAATITAPGPTGAQRLLLNGADGEYRTFANGTQTYTELGATRVGEFTVDGTWQLSTRPVVGAGRWDRFVGRADGSIVALGPQGSSTKLVVTGADSTIHSEREVGKAGEKVALLSATAEYAYLWRPTGLVEHNLNAGGERVLIPTGMLDVNGFFDGQLLAADLENGHLAIVRASSPCNLEIFDVTKPGQAVLSTLSDNDTCRRVIGLRLSPDASEIAVVVTDPDIEVTVLSTYDGSISDSTGVDIDPFQKEEPIVAVSWVDKETLRGVVYRAVDGRSDPTPFTLAR